MFGAELHHHRVRNAAIADLQRRAVFDHVGNVLSDRLLHGSDLRQADFHHRFTAFHQGRDLGNMDQAIAIGKRHVRVDFQHDGARFGYRRHRVVCAQAEREVAVLVHRGGHRKDDVGRDLIAFNHDRNVGETAGDEIEPASLSAGARGAAKEKGHMAHVLNGLRIEIAILAHRQDLRHLHIVKAATLL